jgi:HSP20 family molecular chaperone IbpA
MIKKFQDLLTSIDVLNTVHGGVTEPVISLQENSEGREIHVRVPGIEKELLQVEINNNELSVLYLIPVESSGKVIHMPQFVYSKAIPYFIELNGIKAVYRGNELVVKLPFNKRANGYNRRIKIGEE